MKILTGSDGTVTSPSFVADDGFTGTDTDSTPTVNVTSAAGQTLTVGAVANLATPAGAYTVTIQGLTNPDRLTLTWAGKVGGVDQQLVQTVEVVGGVYVSLADLMAMRDVNLTVHTTTRILELRDVFEDLAERYTGRSFVPRFGQETIFDRQFLTGRPVSSLLSVIDNEDDEVDFTDWQIQDGRLYDSLGSPIGWVGSWPLTVGYVYGETAPPAALVDACKDYVRARLLSDGNRMARDTLRQTDPAGITEQFSTPDWKAGRPTGYLTVDNALNAIGREVLIA